MRRAVSLLFTSGFIAVAALASAQPGARGRGVPEVPGGGAMFDVIRSEIALGPIVVGAPYSAEGVTTTTQTLGDGTRIERTTTTKLYRDSEGRIRREQTIVGLSGIVATGEMESVTIVDPVGHVMYSLVPAKRSGVRSPMPSLAARENRRGAPPPPAPPPAGDVSAAGAPPPPPPPPLPGARGRGVPGERVPNMPESLGTRQIEGLTAVGTKRSEVIPVGRIGNDRPIEVSDERWESPDLKVLVLSRHHDPRTGDVEYRLTNIIRADPLRDLFAPPSDYTITDAPPPPPPAPRRPEQ